jgi:hypothetical protein
MATINTTGIFPSAKFISTNGSGDLQEVVSEVETFGSVTHDGLTFTANAGGLLASPPSIEIVEDANATGIEFSSNGDAITMAVQSIASTPAVPATFDEVAFDGITFKAEVAGDSGFSVLINEGQLADNMDFANGVLTIDLDSLIGSKTQADIANLYALAGSAVKDNIEITFTNLAGVLATTGSTDLAGGTDEVPEVPAVGISSYTQSQVQTAFNGASGHIQGLVSLSISDASANLVSTLVQTEINGTDAIQGNLDVDSDYILIKRTDLHDLEASEQNDGRKFLWGVIHKAEAQINSLSDKPENFTLTKGNPVSADQGTALSQSYSVRVKYGIDALDLKAEA